MKWVISGKSLSSPSTPPLTTNNRKQFLVCFTFHAWVCFGGIYGKLQIISFTPPYCCRLWWWAIIICSGLNNTQSSLPGVYFGLLQRAPSSRFSPPQNPTNRNGPDHGTSCLFASPLRIWGRTCGGAGEMDNKTFITIRWGQTGGVEDVPVAVV